jgi:surfactin synthase thioesterase subunit
MALGRVDVAAVQLPGREGRMAERPIDDLTELVDGLADAVAPLMDRPTVFFGHSMGSLIAFELARELLRRRLREPDHLMVSGRRSPRIPESEPPLHPLPDDALFAELERRFDGVPAVIKAEPDLMALFAPVIRADLKALETHAFRGEPLLDIPITALGGADDARVTPEGLEAWRDLTTSEFSQRRFPGGHFYLHDRREPVLAAVSEILDRLSATRSPV